MQRNSLRLLVLLASAHLGSAFAHGGGYLPPPPPPPAGGSYTGPGDTTPTGGGGGTAGPATGGPSGPAGPATGGPSRPQGPATGGGGGPKGASTGTQPKMAGAVPTGAADGSDPTSWEMWWLYNKDRYLNLKSHVSALEVVTGSDEAFLSNDRVTSGTQNLVSERVLPALRGLLERERQHDVVTGATIALARLADGPLAERAGELGKVFAAYSNDPNQEIAETSVLARGIVSDGASAFELVDLLENSEAAVKRHGGKEIGPRTRAFAGYALGLLGANTPNEDLRRFIVHHLVRTLREDRAAQPDVQVACVIALGLTPLEWSKAGHEEVQSPATPAAARKSASIATACRETQLECLLATLADTTDDRWVRAHVPAALARLSAGANDSTHAEITRALLERIVPAAREKDAVVQGCVLALGSLGDADRDDIDVLVRNTLKSTVLNGDQQARRFALIALAQCAARRGESGADEGAAEVRTFLSTRLSDGRSNERCWAALSLGILEFERVKNGAEPSLTVRASVLAALRDSGSGDETGALAIAAGLMGDKNATPLLLGKLERTSESNTLGHLAIALGLVGDPRANAPLKVQLATSRFKPLLLRETAIGLALLEDPSLVPSLIDTLEKANSLASQSAAASVLGWIGDRRTIDPLLALIGRQEASTSARAFAAVALGRVCDADRLPWNAVVTQDIHYCAATPTLISADGTGLLDIL